MKRVGNLYDGIGEPENLRLAFLNAIRGKCGKQDVIEYTARLDENLGAAELRLTAEDLRDIQSAASKITVQGDRYPEALERMTGR